MPLKDYKVGLVIGKNGVSTFQRNQLMSELSRLAPLVDGLQILVATWNVPHPEYDLDPFFKRQAERVNAKFVAQGFTRSADVLEVMRQQDQVIVLPGRARSSIKPERAWYVAGLIAGCVTVFHPTPGDSYTNS